MPEVPYKNSHHLHYGNKYPGNQIKAHQHLKMLSKCQIFQLNTFSFLICYENVEEVCRISGKFVKKLKTGWYFLCFCKEVSPFYTIEEQIKHYHLVLSKG